MPSPANSRALKLMLQLGGNLQRLRIERGYTQERLAELTELDLSYTQRVERGEVNLTIGSLAVFAEALGVEPGLLLRPGKSPIIKKGRPKKQRSETKTRKKR